MNRTQLEELDRPATAPPGGAVEYPPPGGAVEYPRPGGEIGYPRPGGGIGYRSVVPADRDAMLSFLTGLSLRTRFLRFFTPVSPPSPAVLRGMCGGGRTTDAIVATHGGVIVGHGMAADSLSPEGCLVSDIGVVVTDGWQSQGIGSQVLDRVVTRATARGVSVLVMDVLPENKQMLAMIARRWPGAGYRFGGDAVTARVYLPGVPRAKGACGGADLRAA